MYAEMQHFNKYCEPLGTIVTCALRIFAFRHAVEGFLRVRQAHLDSPSATARGHKLESLNESRESTKVYVGIIHFMGLGCRKSLRPWPVCTSAISVIGYVAVWFEHQLYNSVGQWLITLS